MVKSGPKWIVAMALAALLSGCGYTTKSLLPSSIKNISVSPVKNAIDVSSETNESARFRVNRPGLEIDVTNAIINRFIFNSGLKVTDRQKADAVIEAKLVDFRRDALRYTEGEDVEEYRISVVIDCTMFSMPGHKVLWHENAIAGQSTYFLSGPLAVSEDQAVGKAVDDLAERVVEKTVEIWP